MGVCVCVSERVSEAELHNKNICLMKYGLACHDHVLDSRSCLFRQPEKFSRWGWSLLERRSGVMTCPRPLGENCHQRISRRRIDISMLFLILWLSLFWQRNVAAVILSRPPRDRHWHGTGMKTGRCAFALHCGRP